MENHLRSLDHLPVTSDDASRSRDQNLDQHRRQRRGVELHSLAMTPREPTTTSPLEHDLRDAGVVSATPRCTGSSLASGSGKAGEGQRKDRLRHGPSRQRPRRSRRSRALRSGRFRSAGDLDSVDRLLEKLVEVGGALPPAPSRPACPAARDPSSAKREVARASDSSACHAGARVALEERLVRMGPAMAKVVDDRGRLTALETSGCRVSASIEFEKTILSGPSE